MSAPVVTETLELQPTLSASVRRPSHSKGYFNEMDDVLTNDNKPVTTTPLISIGQTMTTSRIFLTILLPCTISFFSSFSNALITVGLPVIGQSIHLPRSLYLWPASVYGLTSGAMLLIAGAIADIVGARIIELVGTFMLGVLAFACGLANTGIQLVVFRAIQGVATAMHLPASVALVAAAVPPGRARNIGFGCLGLSQPLGFSVGLVISGIMVEKVGWRSVFYLSGGATLLAAVAAVWALPTVKSEGQQRGGSHLVRRMWNEIDWVGGIIASGGLAMLAYVLALLSADLSSIRSPTSATLLPASIILLIVFPLWMHYRERAGKPALVPNALWKNIPFASTCIMVALSNGAMNSIELFSSLFFQEIQNKSILTTSLYLLPNLLVGVCINLCVGIFVDRIPTRWLVVVSSFLCSLAPLIMALVNPSWSYWYLEFWAQIFAPMSGDVLFTVGLIIVSDNFPEKTQALAGAVYNTVAQFGMSLGVGLSQVVALSVMGTDMQDGKGHSGGNDGAFDEADENAMLKGYRAGFWAMFSSMILCGLIAVVGLRHAGKVGLKRE